MHDTPGHEMSSDRVAASADRLTELDALRGLAAFAVLLQHAHQLVPPIAHPDIPGIGFLRYTLLNLTPLRMLEVGRPAVLFFFVLSGYVLMRALLASGSPGLAAFAAQRTIRLGLPVVVSVLLSVLLYWLVADPDLPEAWRPYSLFTWLVPPTLEQVVTNALLVANNDTMRLNIVLWSLVHEWRLTVLLPLLLVFRGRVALFLALVLAVSVLGIMGGAAENRVLLGTQFHSTVMATMYFAGGIGAGVALALAFPAELPRLDRMQTLAAAIACFALFSMASDIAVYGGAVLLILLARQPGRFRTALRVPLLAGLGRISYSLYLVHVPVLVACLHLLHDSLHPVAVAALGVGAALVAGVAMNLLVESPSRRLARRVEKRLAQPGWRLPTPERRAAPPKRDWSPEGGMWDAVR
ncbi:acyltransferase family protein [Falsiroseomonas sp. CW058]|uniref:acyltransferase family protein n=1 Tax=Falsiroseomonas sp. CW058 TaxID=3388664 RepID=UPI003D31D606